jgi:flavin reductase (DIM6/NTAB) family NADH-FMN oxidoreductase RutF
MQHFTTEDFNSWDRFYRANFINSLTGFKSASLIGTVNAAGQTNLAIFSNIVHLGANPALVGIVNRPKEAAPHTIANIEQTKCFTINHITPNMVKQAHQTSAKYPAGVSEFSQVHLTSEFKHNFIAPFVAESPVQYALQLVEIMPIQHNNTFFIIGEILAAYADANLIAPDGFLQLEKAETICSLGIDGYYKPEKMVRYSYAKPSEELSII